MEQLLLGIIQLAGLEGGTSLSLTSNITVYYITSFIVKLCVAVTFSSNCSKLVREDDAGRFVFAKKLMYIHHSSCLSHMFYPIYLSTGIIELQ